MVEKQILTIKREPMREKPITLRVIGETRRVRKPDCSGSIGSRVVTVLKAAIQQVSSGEMKFSVRNLFYAVRELHDKKFPGCRFYKTYDGFSQDFLRGYEKRHGKISGLTRMARGKYATPQEDGGTYEFDIKPGMRFVRGCSNKVLIVEKAGLYGMMMENRFDIRLDVVLAYTQGFTTEAGRNMLIDAQSRGLDVCVLHDYDVAGLLIYSTLLKPTKRLDTYLEREGVYDLGLNWEVITEIREDRDMTPESVVLNKSHTTALGNMLDEGLISGEEYDLLREGRIELNQLTPLELLEWLEKRLEALGLWKTIPEQDVLDERLEGHIDDALKSDVSSRAFDLDWSLLRVFGVDKIFKSLLDLNTALGDLSKDEVRDIINELYVPGLEVSEIEADLREDPMRFWVVAMEDRAGSMIAELNSELDTTLQEPGEGMMRRIREGESVKLALTEVEDALSAWSSDR